MGRIIATGNADTAGDAGADTNGASESPTPKPRGPYRKRGQSDTALAFNRGSDARLAGLPLSMCDYSGSTEQSEVLAWKDGWRNVDSYWGTGVNGRWYVEPLCQAPADAN
jgi:ribosome modulation factor